MGDVPVRVIDGGVFKKTKQDSGTIFIISYTTYKMIEKFSV